MNIWEPLSIKMHLRPSRWDRSNESLKAGLTISNLEGASVICLTEVADKQRPAALTNWCDTNGWFNLQLTQPWQSGETAILYDTAIWQVVAWDTVAIGPDLGPGLPVVCTIAILKHHLLDLTALVSVSHLPSAVEGDWQAKTRRVIAYRRMVINYRKAITKFRKTYKPDIECVSADWNLDFLKKWVRIYIGSVFPAHYFVSTDKSGTHGNRQIDAWLLKDAKGKTDVMPAHRSSDHRASELHLKGYID